MKETITNLEEGSNNKKYKAHIINKNKKERVLHFGDKITNNLKTEQILGYKTKSR